MSVFGVAVILVRIFPGEWPSGLERCSKNRKVPGSNPTRRSAGLRDSTSLQGSRWPSGCKRKTQWLTSGEWVCPLDNGPKLAVGQPNSSWRKLFFLHSDRIRRDMEYLSVFSPNTGKCGKNADQNNSEYEHFLRSRNGYLSFSFWYPECWDLHKVTIDSIKRRLESNKSINIHGFTEGQS